MLVFGFNIPWSLRRREPGAPLPGQPWLAGIGIAVNVGELWRFQRRDAEVLKEIEQRIAERR